MSSQRSNSNLMMKKNATINHVRNSSNEKIDMRARMGQNTINLMQSKMDPYTNQPSSRNYTTDLKGSGSLPNLRNLSNQRQQGLPPMVRYDSQPDLPIKKQSAAAVTFDARNHDSLALTPDLPMSQSPSKHYQAPGRGSGNLPNYNLMDYSFKKVHI